MTPANSVLGLGCLVLFLLPFAGIGIFTGIVALQRAAAGNWQEALFLGLFALTFGGVGLGGILAALAGNRKLKEQGVLEARHPSEPWLWRQDWASGRIADTGRGTVATAWIFTTFWNLVSLPGAYFGVREALLKGNYVALLSLLFPLVGLGLLVWAVRATVRYRKYGASHLQLSTIPAVIGRTLAGTVSVPGSVLPEKGFRVTLSCVRLVTTGSGKSRSTSEDIQWQEERIVPGVSARSHAGRVTNVPTAFRIPAGALATDNTNPSDRVEWRLQLQGEVPGVDYDSVFEVPVFRTVASEQPLTAEEERLTRDPLAEVPYQQPPDSRIVVTRNRRGTEVLFPAARNPGAAAGSTVFLLIWIGATVLQVYLGAPVIFPIIFGFFGILILFGVLDLWMGVSRVNVDAGTLTLAKGYLYPGREKVLRASEIADVAAIMGMRSGNTPFYDVVLLRPNGKKVRAGRGVRDKREAEWLAERIKEALK